MQISDSVSYLDGGPLPEAQDDPLGEVTLGTGGALGLRSRLLRASECGTGYTADPPWTTFTIEG
ncbi:hypothetical protein I3F58_28705 [Streptomyces sp. MUM 203J]|uniref:hypothetical protein n=1 Tax=Streptomyces sp. MUM 203J TaxID=2791990 RepID=UPI001F03CBA4|nr:hypothetical protein [Streptomyces sp. MUM 203J]MCH0543456.1 hypothetical protein [Streptomyces sp. MUM 203J]